MLTASSGDGRHRACRRWAFRRFRTFAPVPSLRPNPSWGARRGEEWSSPASQVVSSRTAAMAPCGFDLNPHSSEPAYARPRIGAVGRCCQGETRGDFGDCMNTIHRDTRARRSQYRDFGYPHTLVKDTPSCHCTCRCREAYPVQAGSIILLPLRVQLSIRRRSGLEPAMRWGRSWQGRARGPLSL